MYVCLLERESGMCWKEKVVCVVLERESGMCCVGKRKWYVLEREVGVCCDLKYTVHSASHTSTYSNSCS